MKNQNIPIAGKVASKSHAWHIKRSHTGNEMKKIEWFSLVLIILWCFAFIVPKYIGLWVTPKYVAMKELGQLQPFTMLIAYCQYGITCLVQIAVAIWLFLTAKREKETPWVWALLGLTYGVLGAILFFGYRIHQRLNENKTA